MPDLERERLIATLNDACADEEDAARVLNAIDSAEHEQQIKQARKDAFDAAMHALNSFDDMPERLADAIEQNLRAALKQ